MIIVKLGKQEKPKYGKVIALTAITVALAEAAAFIGLKIAKKVADSKIEPDHSDDDFIHARTEDCLVEFEAEKDTDEETDELVCETEEKIPCSDCDETVEE